MSPSKILALLCQGSVSSESAKMCPSQRSKAELKHFEKLKINVNGLPISERSVAPLAYNEQVLPLLW